MWPRLVLIFAPLLVLLYVSVKTFTITYYTPLPGSRDLPHPEMLDPIITRGDLARFAAGDRVVRNGRPVRLAELFLKQICPAPTAFGATRYQVGLSPHTGGFQHTTWHLGWPVPWCSIWQFRAYGDIVSKSQPKILVEQRPPGALFDWNRYDIVEPGELLIDGDGLYWSSGAPTPRLATTSFSMWYSGLLAASLTGASLCIVAQSIRRLRKNARLPSHRLKWMVVLVTVFFVPVLIPTMEKYPFAGSALAAYSNEPSAQTSLLAGFAFMPLSVDDLRSMRDRPDVDSVLAAAILDAAPKFPYAAEDDILFATTSSEYWETDASTQVWIEFGFSGWICWKRPVHERCADFGSANDATMPATLLASVGISRTSTLLMSCGTLPIVPLELQASLDGIAETILLILAPGVVPSYAHRVFTRRRAAKREGRGECPSCGYPLVGAGLA